MSLPTRECGLKYLRLCSQYTSIHCHSLHGSVDWNPFALLCQDSICGHSLHGSVDWNTMDIYEIDPFKVTPYTGVWIEIAGVISLKLPSVGHSLHGSVDWNRKNRFYLWMGSCHSLHGSVDWNFYIKERMIWLEGHSLHGSVDWNNIWKNINTHFICHSLHGSVDWNLEHVEDNYVRNVTPYTGVWIEIMPERAEPTSPTVTPYTGVWIEIMPNRLRCHLPMSLPTRECGLKYIRQAQEILSRRHSLHGSVDWNFSAGQW